MCVVFLLATRRSSITDSGILFPLKRYLTTSSRSEEMSDSYKVGVSRPVPTIASPVMVSKQLESPRPIPTELKTIVGWPNKDTLGPDLIYPS
jgi:hypothetical protein